MGFDYDLYEKQCDEMREENEKYLEIFEKEMKNSGLTERTIDKHIGNIDFYINVYLLREEVRTMDQGCYYADMFLGYFFITKCMWSSPGGIRSNIASLKKFYKCMLANGYIDQNDYDYLIADIKDNKDEWIQYCIEYDDPNCENPFEREMREFFGEI